MTISDKLNGIKRVKSDIRQAIIDQGVEVGENDSFASYANRIAEINNGMRNVGEIVTSTIPLTDAGLHLLDGALLAYGSYQAFIDYIADLYDSGDYTDIFETEANWQTAVTTYGVCGKFVYDSENNTVRLPKITGILEGTTDVTALGDLVEAGLPNITGSYYEARGLISNATGAFKDSYLLDDSGAAYEQSTRRSEIVFDASDSNTIYGNSNTVQPQAIKVLYYIVVATTTKTDVQVDIDEIATDLNGKADVDLTNVNNSGTSLGASWAMPSSHYEDLTIGASLTQYTAPANGWYQFVAQSAGSSYIRLNGRIIDLCLGSGTGQGMYVYIPVAKNEVITIEYVNITGILLRFRYAIGSESEA